MKKTGLLLLTLGLLAGPTLPFALPQALAGEEAAAAPKADAPKSDKKDDKDVSGGKFAGDPIYVHISPMVLPVINENGVEQLVTVILDVEVKDFDSADEMHSHMPKVMDSLMRRLYGGLGTGVLKNGKLVDVAKVKNKAVEAIGEVIGPENVRDVLVQSIAQRML